MTRSRPRAPFDVLLRRFDRRFRLRARLANDIDRVFDDDARRRDSPNQPLERQKLVAANRRRLRRARFAGRSQNRLDFVGGLGIVDFDAKEETVELRVRKRVRSFAFERVLRRDDEERRVEFVPPPGDRYLAFLRRFEERGLRFRRRSVDFVGENDVREDRARRERKGARPGRRVFLENVEAQNIGGRQIRRELDSAETQVERVGDRPSDPRLAESRNADEEDVSAGEDSRQDLLQHGAASDDFPLEPR